MDQIDGYKTSKDILNGIDPESPIAVIYQSGYPYDLIKNTESHYQNVVYLTLKLMSVYVVDGEYRTSNGRIDLLIKTDKYIYVMEFKYDGSAREAMDQIESKKFENDGKEIIKVGVNFSSQTRNIDQ